MALLSPGRKRLRRAAWLTGALLALTFCWWTAVRLSAPWRRVSLVSGALQEAPGAAAPAEIRICTWNIAHGRGPTAGNWTGGSREARAGRLRAIGALLKAQSPDVVVLNEADFDSSWSGRLDQAQALARETGLPCRAECANLDAGLPFLRFRFGNAVLSRFRISEARAVEFPGYSALETALAGRKRGLLCTLELPGGGQLRLLAVHLESRSAEVRLASARVIEGLRAESSVPLVLAGDFNSSPRGYPHCPAGPDGATALALLLEGPGFAARFPAAPGPGDFTFPATRPDRAIDWVLAPAGWRVLEHRPLAAQLSDHLPVLARLAPPDRAGASGRPDPEALAAPAAVRLAGTPEEIGRQHGTLLAAKIRTVIEESVGDDLRSPERRESLLGRVRAMKPSLPDWYRRELAACAKAAGVDEDELLYAQCEGDIRSLGGCTGYVAFGPAAAGGMEIGRNFDYWGLKSTESCTTVLAVTPRPEDGHAFVSVGWAGILGGWTFVNEKGLFVANNLGGFSARNPRGLPTLILERLVAQKAANLDEALRLVRESPRMRGQALVIGWAGDASRGIPPDAAVVRYDAERVEVTRAADGFAFHSSVGTDPEGLLRILARKDRQPMDAIRSAGSGITLHSVAVRPGERVLWVAHGRRSSAHLGEYVRYDLAELFRR